MINLSLSVLVVAIIGALFGFAGTAAGIAGFAQSTLFVFLALLFVALARTLVAAPARSMRSMVRRRRKHYDYDDR